ncbi:MAG: hypothetical protein JNL03_01825 [Prolixibacteraceae bacterium]|nr:hypothetical protein [Prolixibacteraceae bacterium]
MVQLRKHIQFLAILLIPVYLLVLGSSIKNRHTHVLPNGIIITHSHPFTDAGTGLPLKHSHTKNQILFYQLFTFDFFERTPDCVPDQPVSTLQKEVTACHSEAVTICSLRLSQLRAPPAA